MKRLFCHSSYWKCRAGPRLRLDAETAAQEGGQKPPTGQSDVTLVGAFPTCRTLNAVMASSREGPSSGRTPGSRRRATASFDDVRTFLGRIEKKGGRSRPEEKPARPVGISGQTWGG
jgi:hypothetical protein